MRTARLDRIESNTRKQRQRESDNCLEGYAGILPPFQRARASACVISKEEKKEKERVGDVNFDGKISACRETRYRGRLTLMSRVKVKYAIGRGRKLRNDRKGEKGG